jgi:hypothetical protein
MRKPKRQRRFNRCGAINVPATLALDEGGQISGTAFNLSRSGVLMRTDSPCPSGGSGTLSLHLGRSQDDLRLGVRIVHRGLGVVGLMLDPLDETASDKIEDLLAGEEAGNSGTTNPSGDHNRSANAVAASI